MAQDARGLAITAENDAAAAHLDAAVAAYCGLRRDAGDRLKLALGADRGLVLGHVLRGYFMLLFATRDGVARAAAAQAAAVAVAAGADARERLHLDALAGWTAGDLGAARAQWDAILARWPRDLLALKLAQYASLYLGDSAAMLETTGRVLGAWDARVPGYGFVLGCHAFALEECGRYDAAERAGREAVAIEPADIWAAHAVAHVFEMEDRPADGSAWIARQEAHWGETNNFRGHLFWHRGLFLLALGRFEEALARYDSEVRAEPSDEYLDIANAVALLWRLEQEGLAVGERWHGLAERARAHLGDHVLVFADLHYLMALAGAGDGDGIGRWRAAAQAHAAGGDDTAARVLAAVGLALGEAAVAHRRRDWAGVIAALLPVRADIARIGGSHAQRDLFAKMLIDAALEHRPALARTLIAERLAARPRDEWGRRQWARAAGA
jgi:tetratricopeptide (TPR) repeat protein